jgi:hypothetical protein
VSRLLGNAEQPLVTESTGDFLMRDRAASLDVGQSLVNLIEHVEVVLNVLDGAIVRESVEKFSDTSFCVHTWNISGFWLKEYGVKTISI